MTQSTDLPEGWIAHDGGECPISIDAPVTIKVRGGETSFWPQAKSVVWKYGSPIWEFGGSPMPLACEVIAYKPEQPQ